MLAGNQTVEGKGVNFAVTLKSDGSLVGAIGLVDMVKGHQGELGYWIGKPYWNKGYCTEAGHALIEYAFTGLDLIRIHACHITRNPSSGRVMQKLGMKHEGTRKHHATRWGNFDDLELYGILKKDWEKV